MQKLHNILKMIRQTAGLTQQEVGDKVGASKAYISVLEKGTKEPSLSFLKNFATAFDVPMLLLLWDEFGGLEKSNLNPKLKGLLEEVMNQLKLHFFEQISKHYDK